MTGAKGTPYDNGLWRLHLKMPPDYPKNPPKATFKTRIFHPNVDEKTGAVCLETLKRDWDPKLTLTDILITISCLLIQPNPDSALNATAGALIQEDYEAFSQQARLMTGIHAPIPKHLSDAVREARCRGEESEQEQEKATNSVPVEEQAQQDDTKENDPNRWSGSVKSKGKRPLAELPLQDDCDTPSSRETHSEHKRKSPKTTSTESIVEIKKDEMTKTADMCARPLPVAQPKTSRLNAMRRSQPRIGIRRL